MYIYYITFMEVLMALWTFHYMSVWAYRSIYVEHIYNFEEHISFPILWSLKSYSFSHVTYKFVKSNKRELFSAKFHRKATTAVSRVLKSPITDRWIFQTTDLILLEYQYSEFTKRAILFLKLTGTRAIVYL